MRKISIIGLGWLGMPLGLSLLAQGYQVVGSKTSKEGVEAVRIRGIECYQLNLTPLLEGDAEDIISLFQTDTLVITLPIRRNGTDNYLLAVQHAVERARATGVQHFIFTSSISVYGNSLGFYCEDSPTVPVSSFGQCLVKLENWLYKLPYTSVDILRLAGLVGPGRHPGLFMSGKQGLLGGSEVVNLVHQIDVISAISLLLKLPHGSYRYNLCAPYHPLKRYYYPVMARMLGIKPPVYLTDLNEDHRKIIDGSRICKEQGFKYQYPKLINIKSIYNN
ncbi:NAD-dependent epimerase/dehydratase family protein [Candidatus Palibaumannia cicadellinicola]|uniref:Putative nucleoside-diphosphate-sugar epimerases n=1 Tax=Candidatus Palibaumannia cicadellinicola TaxID=186490 RepID=A0A088MYC1_9GAMM|nr:NAD-dependent epimerase/dehydratase family protein [Candidatus Baumannia cicadellinicola]AIN47325.1 putative nucleoside-diphosphate-sugar epimerases [Candidatus Baumannia cicadellinicola]